MLCADFIKYLLHEHLCCSWIAHLLCLLHYFIISNHQYQSHTLINKCLEFCHIIWYVIKCQQHSCLDDNENKIMIISKNNNNIFIKTIYLKIMLMKINVVSFFINIYHIMISLWAIKSADNICILLSLFCIIILDTYYIINMLLYIDSHKIRILKQFIDALFY